MTYDAPMYTFTHTRTHTHTHTHARAHTHTNRYENPWSLPFLAAACGTGFLETIIYSPFEAAKIQMQVGHHSSALTCFKTLAADGGIRGKNLVARATPCHEYHPSRYPVDLFL